MNATASPQALITGEYSYLYVFRDLIRVTIIWPILLFIIFHGYVALYALGDFMKDIKYSQSYSKAYESHFKELRKIPGELKTELEKAMAVFKALQHSYRTSKSQDDRYFVHGIMVGASLLLLFLLWVGANYLRESRFWPWPAAWLGSPVCAMVFVCLLALGAVIIGAMLFVFLFGSAVIGGNRNRYS